MRTATAADIVGRKSIIRDGIAYIFEERKRGITYVYATRRLHPHKNAVFQVLNRAQALAWFEDGIFPDEETQDLVMRLQAGTWPEPLHKSHPF